MPASNHMTVTLTADTDQFMAAMSEAEKTLDRLTEKIRALKEEAPELFRPKLVIEAPDARDAG